MNILPLSPRVIRWLAAIFVAFLLSIVLVTFYRYASSATDENIFTTPPSNAMLMRPLPAFSADKRTTAGIRDTIPSGCYLYRSGRKGDQFGSLARFPADSLVQVNVFFPATWTRPKRFHAFVRDLRDSSTVRMVPDHVVVVAVTPGGASDRAGVRVGDRIMTINGEPVADAQDADRVMRSGGSGRVIDYTIVRGDTPLQLHVTLASFGFSLGVLVMVLSGLLTFGVGATILLKRPHIIAARLVGLDLVLIGVAFSMALIRRDAELSPFVIARTIVFAGVFLALFPVSRHAASYFPRDLPAVRGPWWSIRLPYIIAGTVFLLFPLQFFTPFNDNARDVLFTVGVLAIATVASAVAAFLTWSLRTPEYRRMNRPIQLARIFSVAAAVVSGIIVVLTGSLAIIGFVGLAFLSLPLAYLYTIGRYRLLDLELRVRRNVQWGVLSVLWGAVAVLLFGVVLGGIADANFRLPRVTISGLSVEVLDTGNADPASPGPVRWVLLLSGILAFIVVRVVRKRGQVFINRRFYRQPTDYTRAVAALAEVLAKRLSLVDLGRGMVERLATVLRLKRAAVFFFRSDGACCCGEAFGVEKEVWGEMRSITDRPFVETVTALTKVSRVDYLPPGLRDRLRSAGFHFLIPIRSQQLLIGAMILGEKQSEGNYSDGEIEFLSAAASQASVAIENAFLYEELAGKERLEHELQIARRIQLASLPQETPALAAFDIAGVSSPAMEVGGDFFDYLVDGDGRLTVVVGDVSGKGTSAALYMSKVQGILRSLHEFRLAPGDMFVRTNRLLAGDIDRSSFVTALCASFGAAAGNALLARAGHLPLYVFAAQSGSVSRVAPRGLGLALDENAKFAEQLEERTLAFARGDVFLFVTDGVTEARNEEGEEYGEERLVGLLQQEGRRTATEIRDALSAALRDFVGKADQHDDQTIVVVRATGV